MAKETTGGIQVKVRMPWKLIQKIRRRAEARGVTINAEILARLNDSFEAPAGQALAGAEKSLKQTLNAIEDAARRMKQLTSGRTPDELVIKWIAEHYSISQERLVAAIDQARKGTENEK